MSLEGDVAQIVVPAAAGLGGAWWGGRITRRSAREAAEREDARRRRGEITQLRAAARVLDAELQPVAIMLDRSLKTRSWIQIQPENYDLKAWDLHRAVLAELLNEDEWATVLRGILAVARYRDLSLDMAGEFDETGAKEKLLTACQETVREARDALRRYITLGFLAEDGGLVPG